jgi:hypothetical protein
MHARLKTDSTGRGLIQEPLKNKMSTSSFSTINDYRRAQDDCRIAPQYSILSPIGQIPVTCYPLRADDNKGWRTVRRCVRTCRRQACRACDRGLSRRGHGRSDAELEEDANIENWDDVEHYGRATYVQAPGFEHNGSLFDIGSRF